MNRKTAIFFDNLNDRKEYFLPYFALALIGYAFYNIALRFVPVAVLTAIFIPEILLRDGSLTLLPLNPRLFAGVAAILIAWKTRSALWTITAGMAIFWLAAWLIK